MAVVSIIAVASACGGGTAPAASSPSAAAASAPIATPSASAPASVASGAATLDAPATVEGGIQFTIDWTGPAAPRDYITIVAKGAVKWTNEPYFNTTKASPGKLVAPTTAGDYELWYV